MAKVLETLRWALQVSSAYERQRYAHTPRMDVPAASLQAIEQCEQALAWLDAFEKHAPIIQEALDVQLFKVRDTLGQKSSKHTRPYERALKWLQDSTNDKDTP